MRENENVTKEEWRMGDMHSIEFGCSSKSTVENSGVYVYI